MARRHGLQLPLHGLQVVAIVIFFVLSVAFYLFLAPFLGKQINEYVAISVYSIFAFTICILYVRCAAIDPSDSGILMTIGGPSAYKSQRGIDSSEEPSNPQLKNEKMMVDQQSNIFSNIACCFCSLLVKEDGYKFGANTELQFNSNEGLFCTLCNAEVGKLSKHCRSCDKCVDGFDHHCRWLNNCIGRKNYITFLSLMATSLVWLGLEFGVGIAAFVRCFVDKRAIQHEVIDRLGVNFSQAILAVILGICTALSLLALVPLAELFFFHTILIRKGMTTYDYVVAIRSQSEPPGPSVNDEPQSFPSSPLSSATTAISSRSLGLQYRGAWCTPPRILSNYRDEIIPHLEQKHVPSTVNPDAAGTSESGKRAPKRQVRISAWKLANLDSNEALRAAAKARASSSVLRPISSNNTSSRDSLAGTPTSLSFNGSYPPSTLNSPIIEGQQHERIQHFNPIYQSSMNQSPLSKKPNDEDESMSKASSQYGLPRNTSSSVYWDQESGRFVSSQDNTGSSSMAGSRREFVYTGQSIFFGGPLLNERTWSSRNANALSNQLQPPQKQLNMGIGRGPRKQLPVFVPRDSQ